MLSQRQLNTASRCQTVAEPCTPRRCVKAHSKRGLGTTDGLLVTALEKVLNQISRIIYDHEAKNRKLKASGEPLDVEVQTPSKKVKFRTKYSAERLVKEPAPGCQAAGRGLGTYLSLPLTEYALLDPKWITRPNPVEDPEVFVLKVPLYALINVDLQPQVTIRVQIDSENCQVHFYATKFMVGDARFDTNFQLDMDATLSHRPVTEATQLGANIAATWRSWGSQLAIATGTAPHTTPSTSTRGSNLGSVEEGTAIQGSNTAIYDPNPAMVSLPRSMAPRSTGVPLATPSLQADTTATQSDTTTAQSDSTTAQSDTTTAQSDTTTTQSDTTTAQSDTTASRAAARAQGRLTDPLYRPYDTSSLDSNGNRHVSSAGGQPLPTSTTGTTTTDGPGTTGSPGASPGGASMVVTSTSGGQPGEEAAADAGSLQCSVDLRFDLMMPSPLSIVPGPMLSLAGGLLAKFAVRAMLPGFLELLSVDYARWATGSESRSQAAGNLLAARPDASTSTSASGTSRDTDVDVEFSTVDAGLSDSDSEDEERGEAGVGGNGGGQQAVEAGKDVGKVGKGSQSTARLRSVAAEVAAAVTSDKSSK